MKEKGKKMKEEKIARNPSAWESVANVGDDQTTYKIQIGQDNLIPEYIKSKLNMIVQKSQSYSN